MHIGRRIREILESNGMTVKTFAERLPCSRENAHRILQKQHLDTQLLNRICDVLNYDLYKDLSRDRNRHSG